VRAQQRVLPCHRLPGLHHGVVHTTDDRGHDTGNLGYSVASPKGAHLLSEAATRKLLWIEPPRKATERLFVKLVSVGKWKPDATQETKDGYTLWGVKAGSGRTVKHFDDLDKLVTAVLTARRG
jgi:hypothetical protein